MSLLAEMEFVGESIVVEHEMGKSDGRPGKSAGPSRMLVQSSAITLSREGLRRKEQ